MGANTEPRTRALNMELVANHRVLDLGGLELEMWKSEAVAELEWFTGLCCDEKKELPQVDLFECAFRAMENAAPQELHRGADARKRWIGPVGVPEFFFCPISNKVMENPVVLATGKTVDHSALEEWPSEHDRICPVTSEVLAHTIFITNILITFKQSRYISSSCCPCSIGVNLLGVANATELSEDHKALELCLSFCPCFICNWDSMQLLQPWPPPRQFENQAAGVHSRPIPWPSFGCHTVLGQVQLFLSMRFTNALIKCKIRFLHCEVSRECCRHWLVFTLTLVVVLAISIEAEIHYLHNHDVIPVKCGWAEIELFSMKRQCLCHGISLLRISGCRETILWFTGTSSGWTPCAMYEAASNSKAEFLSCHSHCFILPSQFTCCVVDHHWVRFNDSQLALVRSPFNSICVTPVGTQQYVQNLHCHLQSGNSKSYCLEEKSVSKKIHNTSCSWLDFCEVLMYKGAAQLLGIFTEVQELKRANDQYSKCSLKIGVVMQGNAVVLPTVIIMAIIEESVAHDTNILSMLSSR